MSAQRVLVSGASGFLGTHIVNQLLASGFNVRALARGSKVAALRKTYEISSPRFEVLEIKDVTYDTFPDAFVGVDALIHIAGLLPGKGTPGELLNAAIEGTLNIIRQAEKAGVKKVVVTSSSVAVRNPKNSFTAEDWSPVTKEAALSGKLPEMAVYAASKKYAELAVWEWAEAHPHVDVTVFNPPFLYGPLTPQLQSLIAADKPNDYSAFSFSTNIAQLLFPKGTFTANLLWANVEDIAKLHTIALTAAAKPASEVGRKRIVIANPEVIDWKKAVDALKAQRPELKDRLITAEAPAAHPFPNFDFVRVEQVLGFKKSDFTTFEKTVLDTVDSILAVEKKWKDATGVEIVAPPEW
ncbi:hypothetical protein DL96DRAFT_977995 [Flagelloscypha sp. PMI_526]|nr:hypothetical protein DL96DRAFT_977995 [Flagelloscypha sp. PMI_526]